MPKFRMLAAACAATAVLALAPSFAPSSALAQSSRTLKIIVPYTPGSTASRFGEVVTSARSVPLLSCDITVG